MERGKLVSVGLVFILTMIFFLLFLYDTYNYNYQINKDKTLIYDFHREFPPLTRRYQEDTISKYQNKPTEKSGLSSNMS